MKLILGNMNYSSWSIRAALVARASGLEIEETIVPLAFGDTREKLIAETGFHTVPVLIDGDLIIRDSLAITERIADLAEPGRVWPEDPIKRAQARSVVSEMHSGFFEIRTQMGVDIRTRAPSPAFEGALKTDIDRVLTLWQTCREQFGADGPFMFGEWCAADAFYAPVVTRFRTYGYELSGVAADYAETIWNTDLMKELEAQAEAEPWEIELSGLGPVRAWLRD